MQRLKAVDNQRLLDADIAAAPLVPAEVNLVTFPWAPVRLEFLSGHPLALAQQAEPFRALVLLAAHAWRKLPAMTVPDDEVQLAAMAGFGRDVSAWLAIRDEVMQGWVLCSDGRWHHPELAAWALQSWEAKKSDERFRAKQSARARSRKPGVSLDSDESTNETHGPAAAQPYKKEQETTVDEQEKEKERERTSPSIASRRPSFSTANSLSIPSKGAATKEDDRQVGEVDPVVQIFDHWKQRTGRPDENLIASRRKVIQARLDEGASIAQICLAIDNAAQSDFYQGRTSKQTQRIDTLDVICRDSDRILRLASEASTQSHPHKLKPAAHKTAESVKFMMAHLSSNVVDIGDSSASSMEGDAA